VSREIVRNVSWSLAWKSLQVVVGSASVVLLARLLGAEQFGILTWIISASILLALVADLGVSSASARMLAEEAVPARAVLLVAGMVLGALLLAACVAVVLLADSMAAGLNAPFLEGLGWLVALLMLVGVGERFCYKAFEGLRRVDILGRTAIWVTWIGPAAAVLAVIIIAPSARVALIAKGLAGVLTVALLGLVLFRHVGRKEATREGGASAASDRPPLSDIAAKLAGYSVPLFFVALSFVIYTQSDILLIQWILDVEEVGIYGAAIRMVEMVAVAGVAIGAGSAAFFPGARDRGAGEYSALFVQATRGILLIYLPVAAGLLLTAGDVMPFLFGDEFARAGLILAVYTPFIVCRGLSSVYSLSLDYLGYGGARAVAVCTSAAANIAMNLLLIPRFGILGAAVASQITYVPLVLGYGIVLMRKSGTSTGALFGAVSRVLGATAVMSVAVYLAKILDLPLLVVISIGVVTYLFMAVRLGALSRSELLALIPRRAGSTPD
jgi:O-antigen/teichoic acid export membrane protein